MVLYIRQVMVKKYFHEVIEEEEKILAIGLKQSRLHKKERLDREKSLHELLMDCLLYTSPSPRDRQKSRMPSSA